MHLLPDFADKRNPAPSAIRLHPDRASPFRLFLEAGLPPEAVIPFPS